MVRAAVPMAVERVAEIAVAGAAAAETAMVAVAMATVAWG